MRELESGTKIFMAVRLVVLVAIILSIFFFEPSVIAFAARGLAFSLATKLGAVSWGIFSLPAMRKKFPVFFLLGATAFMVLVFDFIRLVYVQYI